MSQNLVRKTHKKMQREVTRHILDGNLHVCVGGRGICIGR